MTTKSKLVCVSCFLHLFCVLFNPLSKPQRVSGRADGGKRSSRIFHPLPEILQFFFQSVFRENIYDAHKVSGVRSIDDVKRVSEVWQQSPVLLLRLPRVLMMELNFFSGTFGCFRLGHQRVRASVFWRAAERASVRERVLIQRSTQMTERISGCINVKMHGSKKNLKPQWYTWAMHIYLILFLFFLKQHLHGSAANKTGEMMLLIQLVFMQRLVS